MIMNRRECRGEYPFILEPGRGLVTERRCQFWEQPFPQGRHLQQSGPSSWLPQEQALPHWVGQGNPRVVVPYERISQDSRILR